MSLLYGLHDRQAAPHVPDGGWCVDTIALSEKPAPQVYDPRINWIVRANWGYGSTGTIPIPGLYDEFAASVAAYIAKSQNANIVIIGNEVNHEQERPEGIFITPAQYARCFVACRDAIKRAKSTVRVLPSPMAPYHANPVNWLEYWQEMLGLIAANGGCDGIAVHAYTRSSNPADITSNAKMGPPLEDTFSGFYTFRDALDALPTALDRLPVYITEFNELLNDGWHDANTGVVQAAYQEIAEWNDADDWQPIQCLILYRWPKFDKWHIEGKQGVIDDFRAAVAKGYTSPQLGAQNQPKQETHLPSTGTGTTTQPSLPPRQWDERLTARGVSVETPPLKPGQQYWRVVKAQWWNEQEAQGRHHIYVEAPDGTPFVAMWPTGNAPGKANGRGGFDAGNFPMSKSLNEFNVRIDDGKPSETLKGIGMGDKGNSGVHTSTGVVFELATWLAVPAPEQPVPEQPVPPQDNYVIEIIGARIRTRPVDGDVLTAVPYGDRVDVVGIDPSTRWRHVRWNGVDGWMSPNLISDKPPLPAPSEPTPQPEQPSGDNFRRAIEWVLKWEGGFSDNPEDHGNWTGGRKGQGELKGTHFGISAASYPTLDIRNLTREQAISIYERDYWQKSGAAQLEWPACLLVLDSSVLHGVGAATTWLKEVGPNPYDFAAKRLRVYTKLDNWKVFGAGWVNRVADLLEECAK